MTRKITSDFAVLNIKKGRKKLRKVVGNHGWTGVRVPVTITGFVTSTWSQDDGTSIEFEVDVTELLVGEPEKVP